MRPVELIAEGFGPFRDRVTVDFTDADFFALVGPTGAGKSSVIDAICFALYGIVPRYADARLVAPALTTGVAQARIQLTFDAGGCTYVATRVVRRTAKGATTKECRLERVAPTSEVIAGDPAAASKAIEEVLGLSAEHFTRAVVLPQGEFAKFLHDKPAERQKLLVELLGLEVYGRMASAARTRAATATATLAGLEGQLADLADATEQAEQLAARHLADLTSLQARVAQAAPVVAAAQAGQEQAARDLAAQEALLGVVRSITVPAAVTQRAAQIADAQRALAVAQEAAEAAEAAAQEAESQAGAAPDIAVLSERISAHKTLAREQAALPAAEAKHNKLAAAAAKAEAALAGLRSAADVAAIALRDAEQTHAAHALAAHLKVGDPCPVCLVPVGSIPEREAPADLQAARATCEQLAAQLTSASTKATAATRAATGSEITLAELQTRCQRLQQDLTGVPPQQELETTLATARSLQQAAKDLRATATTRRTALTSANQALETLARQQRQAEAAYTGQRDAAAQLTPPPPQGDLATDWAALAAWAITQVRALEQVVAELAATRERHRTELADTVRQLIANCRDAGLELADNLPYDQVALAVERAHARGQNALEAIRTDRAKARKLRAEQKHLREQVEVANTMGQLLSARGFESWVLAEALNELVTGASHTLRELSQGAYSLGINEANEFVVIDHREADAIRPARTLSGGETFQASLALALSLSDHLGQFAAGGATKLESIFLDEGFGTLDEDSLEVVAATLETLASGDRVVGVVTHVKELANRVPVRFEVSKTGRTATVERSTK